ncbi:MAG TPA: hypothetical protein PKH58_01335 [Paludibacteraceae bacterium]|nr:hypothetical protein [Paludibacteraceae bacterium]
MNRGPKKNLDKFQAIMFDDLASLDHLNQDEKDQLRRYRFAFTRLLDNPSMSDVTLRDELMSQFGIKQTQAYADISNLKIILPNIRNAGKEWIRYVVNEELKDAIAQCKSYGGDKLKELILAIDKLAKYNKLDQNEGEEIDWDQIYPQPIEPTGDISVLGEIPMENKRETIEKLITKFRNEIEIEDIECEDVSNGEQESIL